MEYECEIWVENKDIDTPYYKQGNTYKFVLDGYDESPKTAYGFYGHYWHGNPQVLETSIRTSTIKHWHEKRFLNVTASKS